MAMDDGCKQQVAGPPPPPQRTTKSSRLRALLPHAACVVPAAAHLARAREPRDVAFVVAAHGALALLLLCLGRHEAAPTTAARGRLRTWVWALSTALTGLFACRVAPGMPPLGMVVYGMAVVVTAGGFALLLLCDDAGDGAGFGHEREKS